MVHYSTVPESNSRSCTLIHSSRSYSDNNGSSFVANDKIRLGNNNWQQFPSTLMIIVTRRAVTHTPKGSFATFPNDSHQIVIFRTVESCLTIRKSLATRNQFNLNQLHNLINITIYCYCVLHSELVPGPSRMPRSKHNNNNINNNNNIL